MQEKDESKIRHSDEEKKSANGGEYTAEKEMEEDSSQADGIQKLPVPPVSVLLFRQAFS